MPGEGTGPLALGMEQTAPAQRCLAPMVERTALKAHVIEAGAKFRSVPPAGFGAHNKAVDWYLNPPDQGPRSSARSLPR